MNRFLTIWFTILSACFLVASCEGVHAFADSSGAYLSSQSLAASVNGTAVTVGNVETLNLQVVVSSCSSCAGVFKLQASNAASPATADWTDIDGTQQTLSADGNFMWNLQRPGYKKLRLVYTRTAGSATANGNIVSKDSK